MCLTERRRHKVLLFIPHLQQGGAERQILELMRRLPARFAPTLCLYNERSPNHYDVERVISLDVRDMGVTGLLRFVKLLRDEAPTIVHSYRDKANLWTRLAALATPVPIVITSVRNRYQGHHVIHEMLLQRVSDRVLANSRGIRDELVHWSRVSPDRVQVIHNFIDVEAFRPPTDAERASARSAFGFAPSDVVFLLPGRLARQKNQIGLAIALGVLRRRGKLPQHARIVLAGRRRDALYSRFVPLAMRAAGVTENVTYLEPVKDMQRLYHASDALLMPSLFEGMSNAVLEAHACGLPAIVTHAANPDGIVIHDDTGFAVSTLDPRAMADAIDRMIEMTAAQRRLMGERGRTHVARTFHPDRVLGELVALYDGLIAEKGLA